MKGFKMRTYLLSIAILLMIYQIYAQDEDTCIPSCRTGYVCVKGECVSECNPPCEKGYKCQNHDCIEVEQPKPVELETNQTNLNSTNENQNKSQILIQTKNPYEPRPAKIILWGICNTGGVAFMIFGLSAKKQSDYVGVGAIAFGLSIPFFVSGISETARYNIWEKEHGHYKQ